jgi:MoaA/NifB/PqqE/SkfB family radical SAM enzyme
LAHRILDTVPRLRASGIDNVRFNTVIKDENLDHVMDIVRAAHELGVGVGFSTYTDMKNGNAAHYPRAERLALVDAVVGDLLAFKRKHRGVITSSDWYLRQIPRYFRGELRDPCASGLRTIHIDPTGFVRRCPDFPRDVHWREFRPYSKIDCNACFYACRGEAQAPLTLSRVRDVVA